MEVHFPYQSNGICFVHDSPWGINMIHISVLNESVLVKVIHFDPFKPFYITLKYSFQLVAFTTCGNCSFLSSHWRKEGGNAHLSHASINETQCECNQTVYSSSRST